MRPTATLTTLLVTLLAWPALGQDAAESAFQVSFRYAGEDRVLDDTVVPLLPDNACYSWYVRLAEGVTPKAATEVLTLPVPLADWGTLATDPDDGIDISPDGKVATRSFVPELDQQGWFSHSWCVAAGDPVGRHTIEIAVDGTSVATYTFDAVLPEDYPWPSIPQPDPGGRGVYQSW